MKRLFAALMALCLVASMAAWVLSAAGAFASAEEATAEVLVETPAPPADTGAAGGGATPDPAATDTPAVTDEAAATDTPAATDGTGETATPAATDGTEATETPAVTDGAPADDPATEASTGTDDPAATEEPYLDPAALTPAVEENVGSGPAWIAEGAHRRYGELAELLPIAMVGGGTVVLCTTGVIELTGYAAGELSGVSFGVDRDALGEYADGRSVIVSAIGPSGQMKAGVVYVWVGLPGNVPTAADALDAQLDVPTDDSALLEAEIMVEAGGFTAGEACMPTFTLHAYPSLAEGMAYAVMVDGGVPQAIGGDSFAPAASGEYRFAILDATGAVAALSIPYAVVYGAPPSADGTETASAPESAEEPLLTQADVLGEVPLAEAAGEAAPPELMVRAYDYAEGTPSSVTPSFVLSGAPAEGSYGISINGAAIVALKGDTYAETSSGEFTYVFYMLDAEGNTVATSGQYHVVLDYAEAAQTGDAWMASGKDRLYGSLASLLRQAGGGETIYLLTTDVFAITGASALERVTLAPDPDTFGAEYSVITSEVSPSGESAAGVTYVWLGADVEPMAFSMMAALSAPTFTVDAISIGSRALSGGLWVNGGDGITFTVTDSDPANTYLYEISTDGGVTFEGFGNGTSLGGLSAGLTSGNSYALVFRLTAASDPLNTVTTAAVTVNYDNERPSLVCKAGEGNTVTFYAGDAASGFGGEDNVTFNATASPIGWVAQLTSAGGGVYTYAAAYTGGGVIAAGTLAVRDRAGNVAVWGEEIVIGGGRGAGGFGGSGGFGGRGGGGGRSIYHSASTYDTVTAYGGVDLVVETGAMDTLTIGQQQLGLTLAGDDGTEPFVANLLAWGENGDAAVTDTETDADTLVLSTADAVSQGGAYAWTFDGTVYKKLAASGLSYMVFTVGDRAVALSTAGFAGGVRYNMYRAAGLASRAFEYTLRMDASGSFTLSVTVEGQTYALTGDQQSDFYYYDVLSGTVDMLARPYGQGGAA